MADDWEWVRTIVGGLVGGGVAGLVSWARYVDEKKKERRQAFGALHAGVERLVRSAVFYGAIAAMQAKAAYKAWEALTLQITEVNALVTQIELLDTDADILEALEKLAQELAGLAVLPHEFKEHSDVKLIGDRVDRVRASLKAVMKGAKRAMSAM